MTLLRQRLFYLKENERRPPHHRHPRYRRYDRRESRICLCNNRLCSGFCTVEDLLASVPGLEDIANLSSVQVSNIGSEDMTDEIWARLVKETESQLKDPEVTGVVITHGTDTLEETAFMLNQVLKSEKPVVLVGSMRPATSISADGPMNLLNAAKVAASPEAKDKGVLVVLNDEIHGAETHKNQYHELRHLCFSSLRRARVYYRRKSFFL